MPDTPTPPPPAGRLWWQDLLLFGGLAGGIIAFQSFAAPKLGLG